MKKVIIAPDSFKGTMTAEEVCAIIKASVLKYAPDAETVCIPMSDGGEGMVQSYLSFCGGEQTSANVTGPLGIKLDAVYGLLPDGSAVMEMAACAGLPLMGDKKNPMLATTYGVGEMLQQAKLRGVKRVLMGIGGSATNDCGLGMAAALGYAFLDKDDNVVEPKVCNMLRIEKIRKPAAMNDLNITVACDVNNPLFGPTGAAYTFGAQKGANKAMIETLDDGLAHMAKVIRRELGIDVSSVPGGGAAGGLGAGLIAFTGAELKPGIEMLLDTVRFDDLLEGAAVVFTGEGQIDWQSVYGKVPVGVAMRAKRKDIPCIALCGSIGKRAEEVYNYGVTAVFSAVNGLTDLEHVKKTCKKDLEMLSVSVVRTMLARIY